MHLKTTDKKAGASSGDHPGNNGCCDPPETSHPCRIRQVVFAIDNVPVFLSHLRTLSSSSGSHIILFNKEMMAGRGHVNSALSHAFRAMRSGTCISSSVEIEALLYAAGSRQVIDGTKFGIHEGVNLAYLCLCPENEEVWSVLSREMKESSDDWEAIDLNKRSRLMTLFSVTAEELAVVGEDRLKDLVMERVALLDAYK